MPSKSPKGGSVVATYSECFKRVLVNSPHTPKESQGLIGVTEDIVMKPHGTIYDIKVTENGQDAEMLYLAESSVNNKSVILS